MSRPIDVAHLNSPGIAELALTDDEILAAALTPFTPHTGMPRAISDASHSPERRGIAQRLRSA